MKTAMQDHIEWLKDTLYICKENAPTLVNCINLCISDAQSRLEMEKQQIIKAVYDSMGTNFDPNMGRAEQYYNETYKNTKE
jgi:hypothetical protein